MERVDSKRVALFNVHFFMCICRDCSFSLGMVWVRTPRP